VSHNFLGSIGNLSKSVSFTIPNSGATTIYLDGAVEIRKPSGANAIELVGGRVTVTSGLLLTSLLTISQLPAASSVPGTRAMVSDASNGVFRAIVVGGGATIVPVHSDGTNWVIG
jgi:hypothetical protein